MSSTTFATDDIDMDVKICYIRLIISTIKDLCCCSESVFKYCVPHIVKFLLIPIQTRININNNAYGAYPSISL
jgi:hypothetical protein